MNPQDTLSSADGQFALQFLIREPNTTSETKKAVILLHGVGSNEHDLFSFSDQFPEDILVISPRGLYTIGAGRYAWYEVDFSTGKPIINAKQEEKSRKTLQFFIERLKQQYNLDQVYVGGFSQGAIMSFTLGLTHPAEITGIIALSGRILDEIRPLVQKDASLEKLKVFLAHGVQDNTLPVGYAREAKEYLESLGIQLSYREYPVAHEINKDVLEDLIEWIAADADGL